MITNGKLIDLLLDAVEFFPDITDVLRSTVMRWRYPYQISIGNEYSGNLTDMLEWLDLNVDRGRMVLDFMVGQPTSPLHVVRICFKDMEAASHFKMVFGEN